MKKTGVFLIPVMLIMPLVLFVSCNQKDIEMDETKEYLFGKCKITMAIPKGWEANTQRDIGFTLKNMDSDKDYVGGIIISDFPFADTPIGNIQVGEKDTLFAIQAPFEIGEDDVSKYPKIGDWGLGKYGDNHVYLARSCQEGAIYPGEKYIFPFSVFRFPDCRITPELGALFESIRVIEP